MATNILHIDASSRTVGSVTRELSQRVVQSIRTTESEITYRDVTSGLPFVDEKMIGSYFTRPQDRTIEQQEVITLSDTIVRELQSNDVLVIGIPIYNFSMPASFKAWCDLAARVGETFRYTETGPVGLLTGKKAYIAIASGGTEVDSEIDFLTPWLRHFLGFIGIKDVTVVKAVALNRDAETALVSARGEISKLAA